jgi:hypothetical protein
MSWLRTGHCFEMSLVTEVRWTTKMWDARRAIDALPDALTEATEGTAPMHALVIHCPQPCGLNVSALQQVWMGVRSLALGAIRAKPPPLQVCVHGLLLNHCHDYIIKQVRTDCNRNESSRQNGMAPAPEYEQRPQKLSLRFCRPGWSPWHSSWPCREFVLDLPYMFEFQS